MPACGTLAGWEESCIHAPSARFARLRLPAYQSFALPLLAQYGPPQLDAVVVTATRFPEDRLDAPVGMTVITAEDIAKSTARTLPEILSQQGNIVIRNTTGSPDQQVDLRGFGVTGDQNTLVLLDGRRLDEVDLSTPSWSAIPIESIERIEILRGSGGVLYGGGATGGTINIITRTPERATITGSAMVGGGSLDTFQAGATASAAGDVFGATGSANTYQTSNWRENNRVHQWSAEADLRAVGSTGKVDLKFGGDRQTVQLPGPRGELELAVNPRGTATPLDWANREGARALLAGEVALGGGTLAADLGYRQTDRSAFLGRLLLGGPLQHLRPVHQRCMDLRSAIQAALPRVRRAQHADRGLRLR